MATTKNTKSTTKTTTKSVVKPSTKSTVSKSSKSTKSSIIEKKEESITYAGTKTIFKRLPKALRDSITEILNIENFVKIASSEDGLELSKLYIATLDRDILEALKPFSKEIEIHIVIVRNDKVDIVGFNEYMYALETKDKKAPKELIETINRGLTKENKLCEILTEEEIKTLIQTRNIINKILDTYVF